MIFFTNTCLRSVISLQVLSKMNNVSIMHEFRVNYNATRDSPHDRKKLQSCSILHPEVDRKEICGCLKTTISFDDMVHYIDAENILTFVDFECCIFFYSKASTRFKCIDRKWENNSGSFENLKCIPSSDELFCFSRGA